VARIYAKAAQGLGKPASGIGETQCLSPA
jgi:hypothetical protein